MRKLDLDIVWSGPHSYDAAPCEMVFASLKNGDLNPASMPTGKRVSILFSHPNPVASYNCSEHDRHPAPADPEEHLHQVLAPHGTGAV